MCVYVFVCMCAHTPAHECLCIYEKLTQRKYIQRCECGDRLFAMSELVEEIQLLQLLLQNNINGEI